MHVHPIAVDLDIVRLTTYDADGFLGIGIGGTADKAELDPAEAHHPFGLMGRPRDPDVDGSGEVSLAATILRLEEGNTDSAIALGDPRCTVRLPRLEKGSSIHYADTGGDDFPYVLIDGTTSDITAHTPSVVNLGDAGGKPPVLATPDMVSWMMAVSAATGAPMPSAYQATKVKAV